MKKLIAMVALLVLTGSAFAQIESHVQWAYAAKRVSATEAVVLIKATIDRDWHIYSQHVKDGGPSATEFTFAPSKDYTLVGKPAEPKAIEKYDNSFKMNVGFFENSVVFQQRIKLKSPKATTVKGKLSYMTCNDRKCLPPEDVDFTIPVAAK
ncbi:hypothetical protein GCM10027037_26110 [Mucilaginibacter koreensis]